MDADGQDSTAAIAAAHAREVANVLDQISGHARFICARLELDSDSPGSVGAAAARILVAVGRLTQLAGTRELPAAVSPVAAADADLGRSAVMLRRLQTLARVGSFECHPPYGPGEVMLCDELRRIVGARPDSSFGSPGSVMALLHPDDRETAIALIRAAVTARTGFVIECRIRRPDGEVRRIYARVEPECFDGAERDRWIGIVQDVTDLCPLAEEERCAQRLRAIATLSTGVAHDYNNLLTGIIGCLDQVKRHWGDGERARGFLDQARRAASEGAHLSRRLLCVRPPHDDNCATLDLDGVVGGVTETVRPLFGPAIRLEACLQARDWKIRADRSQLELIVTNLVLNACEAMPRGGRLVLQTEEVVLSAAEGAPIRLPGGAYVRLRVADEGIGMDPATVSRIFEPYFTTKPVGRGTGLGLAAVYGIVVTRGGHIGVRSALGRGSTFTVHLPRWTAKQGADDRDPPHAAGSNARRFGG